MLSVPPWYGNQYRIKKTEFKLDQENGVYQAIPAQDMLYE